MSPDTKTRKPEDLKANDNIISGSNSDKLSRIYSDSRSDDESTESQIEDIEMDEYNKCCLMSYDIFKVMGTLIYFGSFSCSIGYYLKGTFFSRYIMDMYFAFLIGRPVLIFTFLTMNTVLTEIHIPSRTYRKPQKN